jgi:hypothetical protein
MYGWAMPDDRFDTKATLVQKTPRTVPPPETYLETRSHAEGWTIVARWELVDDRLEPIRVCIEGDDRRRVSADTIRKLSLGEMLNDGRVALRHLADVPTRYPEMAPYWRLDVIDPSTPIGSPQRGQRLTEDDLEAVANVYREAHLVGRPVNEAVRDAFYLSKDGAAKRIQKARKMLRDRGDQL